MRLREVIARFQVEFPESDFFGTHGPTHEMKVLEELESALGVTLPQEVRQFVIEFGSIQFGPEEYVSFVPDPYMDGCIQWTEALRQRHPDMSPSLVAIHQDESVYYLLDTETGKVHAWESYRSLDPANFYRTLNDFEAFVLYLADLARQ